MDVAALDAELRRLHGDWSAAKRLSELHEASAALATDAGARRFRLTQAWIFALVAGEEPRIQRLEAALRGLGGL